jgi:hypothetical protein
MIEAFALASVAVIIMAMYVVFVLPAELVMGVFRDVKEIHAKGWSELLWTVCMVAFLAVVFLNQFL